MLSLCCAVNEVDKSSLILRLPSPRLSMFKPSRVTNSFDLAPQRRRFKDEETSVLPLSSFRRLSFDSATVNVTNSINGDNSESCSESDLKAITEEPVFGRRLDDITKNQNPRVPAFVRQCIELIESDEKNMETDGLYRASGNLSQVQRIRLSVDQDNLSVMMEEKDVHVLTGSLKLFFRELKESLIPYEVFQALPKYLKNEKERIETYKDLVKKLPPPNRDTLRFLLGHLKKVEAKCSLNRMDVNNLAIVFGPTLIWSEVPRQDIAFGLMEQNTVVAYLLEKYDQVFTS